MRDYAPILPGNSDYLWERSGRPQRHWSSRSGPHGSRPPRNGGGLGKARGCDAAGLRRHARETGQELQLQRRQRDDCAAVSTNRNIMPEQGLPDAAKLLADVLGRTETVMRQAHCSELVELALDGRGDACQ
jgi:hypothetical protein